MKKKGGNCRGSGTHDTIILNVYMQVETESDSVYNLLKKMIKVRRIHTKQELLAIRHF